MGINRPVPPLGGGAPWPPPPPPRPPLQPPTTQAIPPPQLVRTRRPRRTVGLLLALGIFVLVAGGVAAAITTFILFHGTGDVLVKLAPDNSAVYATVFLDPSASQKSNFVNLASKFPSGRDDSQRDKLVNGFLDDAVKRLGMNHDDVRAWLGTQLAFVAPPGIVGGSSRSTEPGAEPPVAALVRSRDDGKAKSFLDRARAGLKEVTWTDQDHDGVSVSVGEPQRGSGGRVAYSLVDHTVVIADDSNEVGDIIDTAHGKRQSIEAQDNYKSTLAQLPSERLGFAYIDAASLVAQLRDELSGESRVAAPSGGDQQFHELDALRGLGLSVSARPDGAAIDAVATIDPGKLSASQKQALTQKGHDNSILPFIPAHTFAVLAAGGLDKQIADGVKALQDLGEPAITEVLDKLGLNDPKGVVAHLTGDIAGELSPGTTSSAPSAGLVIGTNDEASMKGFLDRFAALMVNSQSANPAPGAPAQPGPMTPRPSPYPGIPQRCNAQHPVPSLAFPCIPIPGVTADEPLASSPPRAELTATHSSTPAPRVRSTPKVTPVPTPAPTPTPAPAPTAAPTVLRTPQVYEGVIITTLSVAGHPPTTFAPSYAVVQGAGIFATTPAEVKAIIDARSNGGVSSAPGFVQAVQRIHGPRSNLLYIDVASAAHFIRDALSPSDRSDYDRNIAPDLAPVRSLILSGEGASDHSTLHLFVEMK